MKTQIPIKSFALLIFCVLASRASFADAFSGKLIDEKGSPLVGATVVCQDYGRTAKSSREALLKFSTVSAKNGKFTFNDFPPEAIKKPPVTFGILLPNGHLSSVTFRVTGGVATVRDQRAPATFRVVDGQGRGVEGAEITLRGIAILAPNGTGFFMQQGEFANPLWFKSGPDGAVRCPSLPMHTTIYYECRMTKCPEVYGDFVTAPDQPSNIKITVMKGVTLRGRVTHLGRPESGAYVQAKSHIIENNQLTERSFGSRADAQGAYSIVAAVGSINITASTQNGEKLFSKPILGVHAAAGAELDGLDISLVDPITVTGRVLEEGSEKPVKNAQVIGIFGDTNETKTTGLDGSFKMVVPPGKAQVRIQHVGDHDLSYPYPELNADIASDHNPPLTFYVSHVALLPPIRNLEGVVRDPAGQPVKRARVGIIGETTEARTDGQGRFRFNSQIIPGSMLYAVAGGMAISKSILLLDQHHLSIKLESATAECSGKVVDDIGRPVGGAEITLNGIRNDINFTFDHVKSDAEGRFHFSGLYSGMEGYAIVIKKAGYGGFYLGDLMVVSGHSLTVHDITIPRADASISGKVLNSFGRPVGGVLVTCGDANATTDEHGVFHLIDAARGDDYVNVAGADDESGSASARGGQIDVVIHMQKSGRSPTTAYDDMRGQSAGVIVPGESLNASRLDPASLKGKIVVIDLWAVWCGPCVRSLPEVEALYKKYLPNGVAVIGIHITGTPVDQAKQLVKQKGLSYPIFMDTDKGANAATFPTKGIPQLYVISAAGKIVCDTHDLLEAAAAVDAELKKR